MWFSGVPQGLPHKFVHLEHTQARKLSFHLNTPTGTMHRQIMLNFIFFVTILVVPHEENMDCVKDRFM